MYVVGARSVYLSRHIHLYLTRQRLSRLRNHALLDLAGTRNSECRITVSSKIKIACLHLIFRSVLRLVMLLVSLNWDPSHL